MTPNGKSFQMPVNCRIAATAIIGAESGKRTWRKTAKNPAPSRRAAFRISSGVLR
jgi:hypothetical protein